MVGKTPEGKSPEEPGREDASQKTCCSEMLYEDGIILGGYSGSRLPSGVAHGFRFPWPAGCCAHAACTSCVAYCVRAESKLRTGWRLR